MKETVKVLERVLGRDGLSRLAGELGGQVIRVPAASTVARPDRIAAAQRAIDGGATQAQAAAEVGCGLRTVARYAKIVTV